MAEVFIISNNGYCFADGGCELAPTIEKMGESLSSDPISFMPDVEDNLKLITHAFVENTLKACIPRESMQLSYIWKDGDAKTLAQQIMHSSEDEKRGFIRYAQKEASSPFIAMTLSQLAATSRGGIVAASILKGMRDPKLGVSILFGMENPARAARVLNLWKMMSAGENDKITFALNHASTSGERMQIYEYGANINAELFYNPLNALQVSERLLIGFDEYEMGSKGLDESSWGKFLLLQRARKKLEAHLSNLAIKNLIEPCRISYSPTGRIDEMECPLIPPPTPIPQSPQLKISKTPVDKDSASAEERVSDLIDEYEYCEDMLDQIIETLAEKVGEVLDSSDVYTIRSLLISLTDTIDDIELDKNNLEKNGIYLPQSNDVEELKSFLDEVEDSFIDLENASIDKANLSITPPIPQD